MGAGFHTSAALPGNGVSIALHKKIIRPKLNPAQSDVDLQSVTVPHPATGRNHAKLNSVEVNILLGKMEEEIPVDVRRSAPEVARRALALSAIISIAHGDDRDVVSDWLRRESLWSGLSPKELAFVANRNPDRKDVIAFTWHTERLVPLLWAIQKIAVMPPLTSQCDTGPMKSAIVWPPAPTQSFIQTAALRPDGEVDEEYERIYQAHWRVRDAERRGLPPPDGLDEGAIFERHWGFNWLVRYFGQPWDEIMTDT